MTQATINKFLNDYQNDLQKMNISLDQSREENVITENFETPESGKSIFETSSYQNISNFIKEDSDNINKLIPEVSIQSSEREFLIEENQELGNKTTISWGPNFQNLSQQEKKFIEDELESASKSLLEDEDFDFDLSQVGFFLFKFFVLIFDFRRVLIELQILN